MVPGQALYMQSLEEELDVTGELCAGPCHAAYIQSVCEQVPQTRRKVPSSTPPLRPAQGWLGPHRKAGNRTPRQQGKKAVSCRVRDTESNLQAERLWLTPPSPEWWGGHGVFQASPGHREADPQ